MPSYLITGASRGIGLAIVEELLAQPNAFVIATARNISSSKGLQDLSTKFPKDRLALLPLDVSDASSVENAAKQTAALTPSGLDYLILNAGVHHQPVCTFDDVDFELLQDELRFNTEYPVVTIRAFLPLIRKSEAKKVVFLSSILGSVEVGANLPNLTNAYSISKAALNMVARKYGAVLKLEGINVIVLHPGWVATDIGDGISAWMETHNPNNKQITTKESAVGSVKVIQEAKLEDSPAFYNYDGTKIAW